MVMFRNSIPMNSKTEMMVKSLWCNCMIELNIWMYISILNRNQLTKGSIKKAYIFQSSERLDSPTLMKTVVKI